MHELLIYAGILFLSLFSAAVAGFFVVFGFVKPFENAKQAVFLFRWFLIGRYHCNNLDARQRAYFKLLHKLIWGGVIIGWTLFLAEIVSRIAAR